MKNLLWILSLLVVTSCVSNRYALSDEGADKKYLIQFIKDSKKEGKVTNKPLIVLDGITYDYESLKERKLPVKKVEIDNMVCLPKDEEGATNIYGDLGEDGVVLIMSKQAQYRVEERSTKSISDSRVLFLIDGKEATQSEIEALNPNDIESIDVIKSKESVSIYTSEDYDGVVIIHLKGKD